MDVAQDTADLPRAAGERPAPAMPRSVHDGSPGYRGVLRAIAGSVDDDTEAALDYVLVKHGTRDGSSYAPTEVSDARELDAALHAALSHLPAPKDMGPDEAGAMLEAIGAFDMMAARRAQLLADGYSASLTRGPHYVTLTVARDGRLFPDARATRDERDACATLPHTSCSGACTCSGVSENGEITGFCSISLTLAVRASGCIAALTSPGAWDAFHVEEILVPEIFMASTSGTAIPAPFFAQLIDARAKGRYREQITRIFARFLVLAFTAFDGRLIRYLRQRGAPACRVAADTTR
jgi:hypothetical protein